MKLLGKLLSPPVSLLLIILLLLAFVRWFCGLNGEQRRELYELRDAQRCVLLASRFSTSPDGRPILAGVMATAVRRCYQDNGQ